jgi:hypothetical protein
MLGLYHISYCPEVDRQNSCARGGVLIPTAPNNKPIKLKGFQPIDWKPFFVERGL